jgi:hypothetical protein
MAEARQVKVRKEVKVNGTSVSVDLNFTNGEKRTFTVPDSLLLQFAGFGAAARMPDTPEAADKLITQLNGGVWSVRPAGDGNGGGSVLTRALIEASGKSKAEIDEFLKGKTQAQKFEMRGQPKLLPIIQRIEAEEAAKKAAKDLAKGVKPATDLSALGIA